MTLRLKSSTTHIIDELFIKLHAAGCEFSSVYATDFLVSIKFNFVAGYAPIVSGPFEDADPGAPDEVDLLSMTAVVDIDFESDDGIKQTIPMDYEMLPLFTRDQLEAIEEMIAGKVLNGEFKDE